MKLHFPLVMPIFSSFLVTTEEVKSIQEKERELLLFPLTDSQLFLCLNRMESNEYPVYRFCIVNAPLLFEIIDYDSAWAGGQIQNEFPKTKGAWSYVIETTVFELLKPFRGNISLNIEQEIGTKKKDGSLTGCYRSIRDNESDVSLLVHQFPTIDYDKVDPYQVVIETSVKIMSAYHSKTEAHYSFNDFILTSIKSFDRQTWFAVLAMVAAFFGLWMTKRALFPDNNHVSLRRRIASALWDTLLLFLSQESTDYYTFLDRLLSILMTLSFFFLTTIYFGRMSTDLVSVTKPTVINSYQDIMNRPNITPVFLAIMPDYQEFEDAYEDDEDSIQAKFWTKYKDKKEMADVNSALVNFIQGALDLKKVFIMNGISIDGVRRVICTLKVGYQIHKNAYTWISRDPAAIMHKTTLIMRNGMKQTPQLKAFRGKVRSAFETGVLFGLLYSITRDGLQSTNQFAFPKSSHSQVERCLSDQIVYAHASVDTVVLQNFQFLFALSFVMLPPSIIVLLIELYCHRNVQVDV